MAEKPASLQQNIIYLCAEFSHSFSQRLAKEFRQNGLTITAEQFAILIILWYREGINQKEVSLGLHRDKTTITRALKNMEKSKLITQATDVNDNRAKLIYLTQKGKKVQNAAVQISGALYTRILRNIGKDKLSNGIGLLTNMIDNF